MSSDSDIMDTKIFNAYRQLTTDHQIDQLIGKKVGVDDFIFQLFLADASNKLIYRVGTTNSQESYILVSFGEEMPQSDEIYVVNQVDPKLSQFELSAQILCFLQDNLPRCPRVYGVCPEKRLLLMQDLGSRHLKDLIQEEDTIKIGHCYETLIHWIPKLQVVGNRLNQKHILKKRVFEAEAMKLELKEFYRYLEQTAPDLIDNGQIAQIKELGDGLCQMVDQHQDKALIHRDYQCKNVMMVENDEPYLVDLQDICLGPMYYDLASLLYDSNAMLSTFERQRLARIFWDQYAKIRKPLFSEFLRILRLTALQRVLKSFGRYATLCAKGAGESYCLGLIQRSIMIQAICNELREEVLAIELSRLLKGCLPLVS